MDFVLGNVPHLWVPLASADHLISVVTQGGARFATANLAYPGLRCITPSAFVLPTEQYRENKANLILPCLIRRLDRGKKDHTPEKAVPP